MKSKSISIMNVFLCFGVIMIHLTSNPVINLRKDSIWYLIFFLINKVLTFAVPAFIFLSGYKLYNKYRDRSIDHKNFYIQRLKKIVIPYVIAFVVYFAYFYNLGWVQADGFLKQLLLGNVSAHFYYIIISIQFYALFPLFKYIFDRYSTAFAVISFIVTVVFNNFVYFEYIDRVFFTYLFYFVFGMYLSKNYYGRYFRKKGILYAAYVTAALIHLLLSYRMSLGKLFYKYAGIGQVVFSVLSIMVLYDAALYLSDEKYTAVHRIVESVDPCTYNIFLYHIMIMNIVRYNILSRFAVSVKTDFIINFAAVFIALTVYVVLHKRFKRKTK